MQRFFYRRPTNKPGYGWRTAALLILGALPLIAQELPPVDAPPSPTVNSVSAGEVARTPEATATAETTVTTATEPAGTADAPKAEATGTGTDSVVSAKTLNSAAVSNAVTNVPGSAPTIPELPVITNTPPPDPRIGDTPGWWFENAYKRIDDYPAFLGARFADASRAVIVETPNRKLTVGRPLVYRLWVCNDLPQPIDCSVAHVIRQDQKTIVTSPVVKIQVNGSSARKVDDYKVRTESLAPGNYTIEATMCNQDGKVLQRYTENIEVLAKGQ